MPLGAGYSLANQIVVTSSGLLWVGDGAENGFPGSPASSLDDVRTRTIRIINTNGPTPVQVHAIDLTSVFTRNPGFNFTVRYLRQTSDNKHVLACIHTYPPSSGTPAPWQPGAVIFINPVTYAIEGIALLSNTSGDPGLLGTEAQKVQGARDCVDSRDGNLWVIQSNDGNTSRTIETFNINNVLTNGPSTPTASFQSLIMENHAEELAFGAGFIWTTGGTYSKTLTRINPSNSALTTYTSSVAGSTHFFWGPFFHEENNSIWCSDNGNGAQIYRFDPVTFTSGPTDTVPLPGVDEVKGGFCSDGTHLWVCDGFNETAGVGLKKLTWYKVDPTAGSANVILTVVDNPTLHLGSDANGTFDGTNIYWGRNLQTNPAESGFAKLNTVTNTLTLPIFTGGTDTGGITGGFWRGCRTVLWVRNS